jgi:hypothetical protein
MPKLKKIWKWKCAIKWICTTRNKNVEILDGVYGKEGENEENGKNKLKNRIRE